MTIAFIIGLVVLFVITWIVIACSAPTYIPDSRPNQAYQWNPELELLKREKLVLDEKYMQIKYELRQHELLYCRKEKYCAIDKERQDLVDMLARGRKSAQELHKKMEAIWKRKCWEPNKEMVLKKLRSNSEVAVKVDLNPVFARFSPLFIAPGVDKEYDALSLQLKEVVQAIYSFYHPRRQRNGKSKKGKTKEGKK